MPLSGPVLPAAYTDDLIRQVQEIIDVANASGEKVLAWERIETILGSKQLLEIGVTINSDFVAVHPDNRSSLGVDGKDA